MALKLIIDSTCDLPKWIIEKFDIQVLPLIVTLEDQVYRDGIDIQLNEVYQAMKNGIVPKTSQVSPESVYQVFTDNCEAGHDFIYVALSKELSGTYQTASMIANEIKEKYPERQLTVIDSKGGSMATGLIVLQAGLLIEKGADYKEVRDYINQAANHVEHIFTISNMEWLAKGGRIPKAVGKVGNLLNIKPLLEVKEGKISLMQMVRGRKKALRTIIEKVAERIDGFTDQYIGITHADDHDTAYELEQMIRKTFPKSRIIVHPIGSVIGVHIGIGGVGIFFFNKRFGNYHYLD